MVAVSPKPVKKKSLTQFIGAKPAAAGSVAKPTPAFMSAARGQVEDRGGTGVAYANTAGGKANIAVEAGGVGGIGANGQFHGNVANARGDDQIEGILNRYGANPNDPAAQADMRSLNSTEWARLKDLEAWRNSGGDPNQRPGALSPYKYKSGYNPTVARAAFQTEKNGGVAAPGVAKSTSRSQASQSTAGVIGDAGSAAAPGGKTGKANPFAFAARAGRNSGKKTPFGM
jgi:hypothetical protein